MPWTSKDARRHTRKAKSAKSRRQWAHVADSMLRRGASEGAAIRAANGVVKKRGQKRKHKRQHHRTRRTHRRDSR